MIDTNFNCLPTMIGSLPHKDPKRACEVVAHFLKEIPAWPQLPLRSPAEGMISQFGEGFPGLEVKDNKMIVDTGHDLSAGLEAIYTAFLSNQGEAFPVSPDHAAGFYEFLKMVKLKPLAVKGQLTGPISFGLSVVDASGKAILYDDTLADAAAKLLRLKAGWQESRLSRLTPRTIIFVDEPGMVSYGSAFFNLPKEKVIMLIDDTLSGIAGLKGIHCCGNTDWGLLISTKTDIVSFDAYNYADTLSLFIDDVKNLIERGGAIAWGIVPNTDILERENAASLKDRLEEAMAPFTRHGISFARLKSQALLTPACSLAALSEDAAEQALATLNELAARMRGKVLP